MKEIKLKYGRVVLVDDDDYDFVSGMKWGLLERGDHCVIAYTREKGKKVAMHRMISEPELSERDEDNSKLFVIHKNGNPLDNRRSNLLVCNKDEREAWRVEHPHPMEKTWKEKRS